MKATVDAYDGSVTLYAWDAEDPILKAWDSVFPSTLEPLSSIKGSLMSHLRYPEDLFKVQRSLLARYHVTNAGQFFSGNDFWANPNDPTSSVAVPQPPYYLTLRMPDQDAASFSLMSSFIPTGTNARNVLTGYLAVDAEAGNQDGKPSPDYGKMRLLELPRDSTVPGPGQVNNNFVADPDVSNELNILGRGDDDDGTEVIDDRQGEQEHLQRRRDTAPEQRHHPDGEGDVGGHRDSPPAAFGSTGVEGEIDHCGHDHATEGGHRRQGGLAAVAQLADRPLAFDLQADDEEEDRHQPVVDDVVEVLGEMERPDGDVDRRRPQRLVTGAPRRVRPHQRHHRGRRQEYSTGRLDTQEPVQRSSDTGQPRVTVEKGGRPQLPGEW